METRRWALLLLLSASTLSPVVASAPATPTFQWAQQPNQLIVTVGPVGFAVSGTRWRLAFHMPRRFGAINALALHGKGSDANVVFRGSGAAITLGTYATLDLEVPPSRLHRPGSTCVAYRMARSCSSRSCRRRARGPSSEVTGSS
jgi:hypothetical protein